MDKHSRIMSSDRDEARPLLDTVIAQKYKIAAKLESGSTYYDMYLGNIYSTKQQVAIKVENMRSPILSLYTEYRALKTCESKEKSLEGIPKVYWYGKEEDNNFLVHELLGPNLDILLKTCNKTFTLKTVIMLGLQMIRRLEYLHGKGYVHRDITPSNFSIGILDKSSVLYLTNLGNAKMYRDVKFEAHKPYAENKQMTGSLIFSSINTHLGVEPSRRDDLESLAYMLVYLYKGALPWQNIPSNSVIETQTKVTEAKMITPAELLCRGMPDYFAMLLNYCKELKYDEKPDYRHMRELLRQAARNNDIILDDNYDWVLTNKLSEQSSRYQFRNMSISFRSTASQSRWTTNDQTAKSSVTAAKFKFHKDALDSNMLYTTDDDEDDMIPHDLGISDMYNDLSFSSKVLLETVITSNGTGHKKRASINRYKSEEGYIDQTMIKEMPMIMKKLTSYPLPTVKDSEEKRNIPEAEEGSSSLRHLSMKTETGASSSNRGSSRADTQYNIVLIGEDGTNCDYLKERSNKTPTHQDTHYKIEDRENNEQVQINREEKFKECYNMSKEREWEARTEREVNQLEDLPNTDKDDKNCNIF